MQPSTSSDVVGSPSKCVVLVPTFSHIEPACERALRELENRGYVVRRQYGFSQIDYGRNVMASAALRDGFEQLMWIDADVKTGDIGGARSGTWVALRYSGDFLEVEVSRDVLESVGCHVSENGVCVTGERRRSQFR